MDTRFATIRLEEVKGVDENLVCDHEFKEVCHHFVTF
jgi:hypothetical protein